MPNDIREVLCGKWALEILLFLNEEGAQNYSRVEAEFDTSSDVINDRLQELVAAGLVSRDQRSPKDVRYEVTTVGEELIVLLEEVEQLLDQ